MENIKMLLKIYVSSYARIVNSLGFVKSCPRYIVTHIKKSNLSNSFEYFGKFDFCTIVFYCPFLFVDLVCY